MTNETDEQALSGLEKKTVELANHDQWREYTGSKSDPFPVYVHSDGLWGIANERDGTLVDLGYQVVHVPTGCAVVPEIAELPLARKVLDDLVKLGAPAEWLAWTDSDKPMPESFVKRVKPVVMKWRKTVKETK
jgi:hypothetical protein